MSAASRFVALALLAATAGSAAAQQPFDMAPERPPAEAPARPMLPPVQPSPIPVQPAPAPQASPPSAPPLDEGRSAPAPHFSPGSNVSTPTVPAAAPTNRRYLFPFGDTRFEGEMGSRSWSLFLTEEQARAPSTLTLTYRNAVLVMPEQSRLYLTVNGQPVLDGPLSAPETPGVMRAEIPAGRLQPGQNILRLHVSQRHRTDCSIQSTYDLWSEIEGDQSFIEFAGSAPNLRLQSIDDLPAVGFDAEGVTTIDLVAPGVQQSAAAANIWRLAQALQLLGNYPSVVVNALDAPPPRRGPGALTVLMGTTEELAGILGTRSNETSAGPITGFIDRPDLGDAVLLVAGPRYTDLANAVDVLASRVDRPLATGRMALNTGAWEAPPVRLFLGEQRVLLSDLGLKTEEFSGRRFSTTFAVGVPSDFYAAAYGEATLLLDAAFTEAVGPESHVDIYVNRQIAATTRIVGRQGGIFRHYPIGIPLRHFVPGVNHITIEANLDTAEDAVCAPGTSGSTTKRFALFDTSEFHMPEFARIAQVPNLAALSGTAFPYSRSTEPVSLILSRNSPKVISTAATLLAKMALQAGRIIPIAETNATTAPGDLALFVGTAAQVPSVALAATGIADNVRSEWREPTRAQVSVLNETGAEPEQPPDEPDLDTEQVFEQWREELSGGGGWQGQVSSFEDWLQRTFDISLAELRLRPAAPPAFAPGRGTSLIFAQASAPSGAGAWTVITAPSEDLLAASMAATARHQHWMMVSGRLSTYTEATDTVEALPATSLSFLPPTNRSIGNLRLIATNWLSSNILVYAVALVIMCGLLGVTTSFLLRRLGRQG